MVRGKKSNFDILEIKPTKVPTDRIKLQKEHKFCGKEIFALVSSYSGEVGERTLNCDIYKLKKDGYIILQMNEGYC